MVVSFKLETDEVMLMKKAQAALEGTGVHCVVANLLDTRHSHVRLVVRGGAVTDLRAGSGGAAGGDDDPCLEGKLSRALVALHKDFAKR
jgi:hypothetical protein